MTVKKAYSKMAQRASYGETKTKVTVFPEGVDALRSRGIDVEVPAKYNHDVSNPGPKKNPMKVTVTWGEGGKKAARHLFGTVTKLRRKHAKKARDMERRNARKSKEWFNHYDEELEDVGDFEDEAYDFVESDTVAVVTP